jgi:hypothetical protein
MHSNLYLFALAIGKTALMTGIGPGAILCAAFARCPFPFCVLRDSHGDDHDVRVPIEQFTPYREQIELFKSFRGRAVSPSIELIPVKGFDRATSPSRKVRRSA